MIGERAGIGTLRKQPSIRKLGWGCLLGILLGGCSLPLAAQDRPAEIRIGVAATGTGGRPVAGGSYGAIASESRALEKEFARDGIKVTYTYFQGAGPTVNEWLANRQLDFAFQGDLPALAARAGGLPTKLILAADRFGAIYIAVPADSPARRFGDLKGKRIGLFNGTNLQMAFYNLMLSKGLKESDFRITNMSTFEGNAALLAGDLDAQVSYNDLVPLVETGKVRFICSTHGDKNLGRLSHLLVRNEFADKWPDLVQRVVNTFLKAAAWEAEPKNRAKVYQIWAKSGFGVSAWKYEYDDYLLGERSSPLFDPFYRAQYKRQLATARQLKLVRRDFDVDAWLDSRFLDQGLKTLGLQKVWRPLDEEGRPQ
jgi:sulfonate transport system substrate-binding protein